MYIYIYIYISKVISCLKPLWPGPCDAGGDFRKQPNHQLANALQSPSPTLAAGYWPFRRGRPAATLDIDRIARLPGLVEIHAWNLPGLIPGTLPAPVHSNLIFQKIKYWSQSLSQASSKLILHSRFSQTGPGIWSGSKNAWKYKYSNTCN